LFARTRRPIAPAIPCHRSRLGCCSRRLPHGCAGWPCGRLRALRLPTDLLQFLFGLFQLDLLAAGPRLDLVAEAETYLLQRLDARRQVIDFEDDPVPPARFLPPSRVNACTAALPHELTR